MSILIPNIKMPTSCYMCWALDEYGDYPRCRITNEQRGYNFNVRGERMTKCPFIEVPTPHGRLIDADKLAELCDIMADKCDGMGTSIWHQFKTTVEWSPIVIPASRGNEDEEHTMDEFIYGQEGNPNDGSM